MLSTQDIRVIVQDIRAASRKMRGANSSDKAALFARKHPEFFQQFPKLFAAALDDGFPLKYLDFMLQQRDALASQPVTKEALEAKDKLVYDSLRKDYIDPLVPPPPPPPPAAAPQ